MKNRGDMLIEHFSSFPAPENPVVSLLPAPRLRLRRSQPGRRRHAQGMPPHVPRPGPGGALPHRLRDAVPVAAEREEELSQRDLSQLATRVQRGADDVLHLDVDAVVEGFRGN